VFLRASFGNIDKNDCGGFREKYRVKTIGLMGAESEGAFGRSSRGALIGPCGGTRSYLSLSLSLSDW
jgi:hypothetical protein